MPNDHPPDRAGSGRAAWHTSHEEAHDGAASGAGSGEDAEGREDTSVSDTRTHYRPVSGWLWNGTGSVHKHNHRADKPRNELWAECGVKMGNTGEPFPYPPMGVGQCQGCLDAIQKSWDEE